MRKKNLNNDAVEQKISSFTPILATCEGILDREAEAYVKRLALHLSKKMGQNIQSNCVLGKSKTSTLHSKIRFKLL